MERAFSNEPITRSTRMAYPEPSQQPPRFTVVPDATGPFINGYEHEMPADAWDHPPYLENPYPDWDEPPGHAPRPLWVGLLAIAAFLLAVILFRLVLSNKCP
jgi:hypothetical protein